MNAILWIIFGGLAGWLATIITGTDAGFGIVGNIIVGIIGAFIGGWIVDRLNGPAEADRTPTTLGGFASAVLGAIILLVVVNLIF